MDHSPVLEKPTEVSFFDALHATLQGKRITKTSWKDPGSYGMLKETLLKIKIDGTWHNWIICDKDMEGEDWVVME